MTVSAATSTPTTTATSSTNNSNSSTTSSASDPNSLANESTFLQLLVAQLQNQDPLNPDEQSGTQMVSELAQFSELEQVMGINQNVQTITTDIGSQMPASTQSSTTPTDTSANTGTATTGTDNSAASNTSSVNSLPTAASATQNS